jgi:NAD(P)-dependent dehydrogenase (short-subunit alcohol dehydrogenase family)
LEAVTEDQIDRKFDVNFKGVFFSVQKAAPLPAKGGSIVVTTSFLNEVGAPGLSILSATKAAVRSLVRSLGAEFAPRGIRMNAVSRPDQHAVSRQARTPAELAFRTLSIPRRQEERDRALRLMPLLPV